MSTPAAAYDSPSLLTSLDFRELGRRGSRDVIRLQRQLELHLVHLQLLRHRDRVGTVEARAAAARRRSMMRREVVPRTIESSTAMIRLPLIDRGSGLSFNITPASRSDWSGWMKVRLM